MKRFKRARRFLAQVLLSALVRLVRWRAGRGSWRDAQRRGRFWGDLAFRLLRRERRRAIENLTRAFGSERSPEEIRELARGAFRHLGTSVYETFHVMAHGTAMLEEIFTFEGEDRLRELLERHGSVVIATGHLGNWEVAGGLVAHRGFPVCPVVRDNPNRALGRLVIEMRDCFGMRGLIRDSADIRDQIRDTIRAGAILVILIDQDTPRARSVFVPFFGRPAATISGAAAVALTYGLPLMVATAYRRPDGTHHLIFRELDEYTPTGDKAADIVSMTRLISRRLEAAIREHPEQWVWMHDRRRRQPESTDQVEVPRGGRARGRQQDER